MRYLFGTDGLRGLANQYPLTPETVTELCRAATKILGGQAGDTIVVGKDTRSSGDMLECAVAAGICSSGVSVILAGVLPTPAVANLVARTASIGGVMISASHNPASDNGIKFFNHAGLKLTDEQEERIERIALTKSNGPTHLGLNVGRALPCPNPLETYLETLISACTSPSRLSGLRIAIDCANGAAFRAAPALFRALGAETLVLNDHPDGENINLNCGALRPDQLRQCVRDFGAHAGVALDGDGDRLTVVDEKGDLLDGDQLLTACALDFKQRGRLAKDQVVGTEMTNTGVEAALGPLGITLVRARVGDRYVGKEMVRIGTNLGGEQSGHIIFLDYSTTADALLSAVLVLDIAVRRGESLSVLGGLMRRFPQVLINVPVADKPEFWEIVPIRDAIRDAQTALNGKGRVSVRYSGTENLARIMAEASSDELARHCAERVAQAFHQTIGVPKDG